MASNCCYPGNETKGVKCDQEQCRYWMPWEGSTPCAGCQLAKLAEAQAQEGVCEIDDKRQLTLDFGVESL